MLIADGGNATVNAALTGPTPTSADFVQAGLIAPPPPNLPAPIIAAGEQVEGNVSEAFGVPPLRRLCDLDDPAAIAPPASDAVLGGRAQDSMRTARTATGATARDSSTRSGAVVAANLEAQRQVGVGHQREPRGIQGSLPPRYRHQAMRRRTSSRPPSSCWAPAPASPSAPPKTVSRRSSVVARLLCASGALDTH